MFSTRFTHPLAAAIAASAVLAFALAAPARADDQRAARASESAACKSARQYALFERQWLLNEGDTDPFQPMPDPSECRDMKTGDGAVKTPSAKDARPEADAKPKAALDTYSAPYLGGA
jgi:hypothetical protein